MILDRMSLDGKIAVVTGGSRGLGRGAALALAEAGADVALVARSAADLEPVADEIRALGRQAFPRTADVALPDDARAMMAAVAGHFGRVDILANFAGANRLSPAVDYPLDEWRRILDTNLTGAFVCCQEAARLMIPQGGGKIINVASMTTLLGLPRMPAYASSKAAIAELTRALAVEWAPHRINVNAIGPGYFRTAMTQRRYDDREWHERIRSRIPLGHWGEASELQGAVVFLASPAASYMTGVMLPVDGGLMAGNRLMANELTHEDM